MAKPDAAPPIPGEEFQYVALTHLAESKTNPRRNFDERKLAELVENIKIQGVLTPLLVRPTNGQGTYEIIAGARRYRAAKLAHVSEIPVRIRALTDAQVLELQVVENLLRDDLHPLEEAEGYRQLLATGYDVARIAERVGRSVKYVYDRVKLLSLTKRARELFLKDKITAGHAILLARLSPTEQDRCIGTAVDFRDGGLFIGERTLFDPDEQGAVQEPVKPVSVRELQAWIDQHVKFDRQAADPMLFPETVATVAAAREQAEKVVQITHEHYVQPEARDGKERIFGPRSWKRADGKRGAKACSAAITGVVVAGPQRGEAFKICVDKKGCKIHWAAEQNEAKRRATGAATVGRTGEERWQLEQRKAKEQREREEAERVRWGTARPAILAALAAAVKKASARANGLLAQIIIDECRAHGKDAGQYVPRGTTAEDLVRHAAFLVLADELSEWRAPHEFPKRAKAFGLDVRKIVDQVAPVPKAEKKTAKAAKTRKLKQSVQPSAKSGKPAKKATAA